MSALKKNTRYSMMVIIIFLSVLFNTLLIAQDISPASEPWGIYVERVEDAEGLERCRVCGRIIGIGSMHMDAEVIVETHLKNALNDMGIEYIDHKGTGRYIHILIYKFTERKGGNLAVEKPASIGLHIHLIEKNNVFKRVYVFEETQQALSQNVLNIRKFLRRRARWLTVSELTEEGIYTGIQKLQGDLK